jgi:hypothetical protein
MSLSDAIDAVVGELEEVQILRAEPTVHLLLQRFEKMAAMRMDAEEIALEIEDMMGDVPLLSDAFPLQGTAGQKSANRARLKIQAIRDRLVSIDGAAHKSLHLVSRLLKVGTLYLKQQPLVSSKAVKHGDLICEVVLREVTEAKENLHMIRDLAKASLSALDAKSKTLEAWFVLHKQYVFMSYEGKGHRGEQETHNRASEQQRRRSEGAPIGRKRHRRTDG